jgi:hypothetical protein
MLTHGCAAAGAQVANLKKAASELQKSEVRRGRGDRPGVGSALGSKTCPDLRVTLALSESPCGHCISRILFRVTHPDLLQSGFHHMWHLPALPLRTQYGDAYPRAGRAEPQVRWQQ